MYPFSMFGEIYYDEIAMEMRESRIRTFRFAEPFSHIGIVPLLTFNILRDKKVVVIILFLFFCLLLAG